MRCYKKHMQLAYMRTQIQFLTLNASHEHTIIWDWETQNRTETGCLFGLKKQNQNNDID